MRNMERGPALPPGARARAERNAQRRAARNAAPPTFAFTPRFLIVSLLMALALGYLAFSLAYPNMPLALYVGFGVAALVMAVQIGVRMMRRRATAR